MKIIKQKYREYHYIYINEIIPQYLKQIKTAILNFMEDI